MTSANVRSNLVHAVGLDLIGPDRGDTDLHSEVLSTAPSRWYLTGFLVPTDADPAERSDDSGDDDEADQQTKRGGLDDNTAPDRGAKKTFFQSSMGMSLLVPKEAKELRVTVRWGDYLPDGMTDVKQLAVLEKSAASAELGTAGNLQFGKWQRRDREEQVTLKLTNSQGPKETPVPNSDGLMLALAIRPVRDMPQYDGMVPKGTRSVSVFLVNRRRPLGSEIRDAAWAFQGALDVRCEVPFVPRPNLRGLESEDWDERVADLQYRDDFEYAVGHGISTRADVDKQGDCLAVETKWIPSAEVERVAPADIADVELRMEELASLPDAAAAASKLAPLVSGYRSWIEKQGASIPAKPKNRKETAQNLIANAGVSANRIEAGIKSLADPLVFEAFRTANKVMAIAARRRNGPMGTQRKRPEEVAAPKWRPFQLAFILMNLKGVADPTSHDREVVDLLFFPTGGGKTEAYLGLAAFTLVYRRLTNPGIRGAGLSVLMRYTLRLLTLDQLGRAATLICALELERQRNVDRLGDWPFEIGLWVGQAATPNVMGRLNDNNRNSARARTIAYQNNEKKGAPIPLEECPWCGEKFKPTSFTLVPNNNQPSDLRITCANRHCEFIKNNPLPIVAVDDPIYRRLPCFLIATVDKFAAMPWTGLVGGFFGKVQRHDKYGFYGPCDPGAGLPIPGGSLPPPDLVIQDELHLISGPMGTLVGLYETALDELSSRMEGGKKIRPKIVASTATVRRALNQIRSLFCRRFVDIFPPPGPDRRDSYFARTHTTQESNARLYIGLAAQGVSPKKILLRSYLALMAAAQKDYLAAGGEKAAPNPADPYMTLLGYFNSLRELGGSRRIVEDEVVTKLTSYASRKREGQGEGSFADRQISFEPVELTSRVSTSEVAIAKQRLAVAFSEKGKDKKPVDVAIATNMISVGLDITRLGLMVVLGQPKTAAEYIQATSRVGRDTEKPGLVVTILNVHRPRDRSHYERFLYYHQTFYRSVEATSVTPFSPRALDRGLAGTLVALARLGHAPMTAPKGATEILKERGKLDWVAQELAARAAEHIDGSPEELRLKVLEWSRKLLDEWEKIAKEYQNDSVQLQYQREAGAASPLLHSFLAPDLKKLPPRHRRFRANRSMRDVEPSVNLWVKTLDDVPVPEDEE